MIDCAFRVCSAAAFFQETKSVRLCLFSNHSCIVIRHQSRCKRRYVQSNKASIVRTVIENRIRIIIALHQLQSSWRESCFLVTDRRISWFDVFDPSSLVSICLAIKSRGHQFCLFVMGKTLRILASPQINLKQCSVVSCRSGYEKISYPQRGFLTSTNPVRISLGHRVTHRESGLQVNWGLLQRQGRDSLWIHFPSRGESRSYHKCLGPID